MPTRKTIDELLAEDDWIRRMARRLVADPGLADDLAQDAWVSALGKSGEARALRPWLGGVLRNLVRSNTRSAGRRETRERAAARGEALPSAAELVEEVTLRREVADHLLALAEPYRSTLYLRFFRDLSLKKIALRMDVPVSTVHGRLQRGLELMRLRLDGTHGGDRRAWAVTLLPLAKSSTGLVTTTLGGVAMSTGLKVAAGIVVAGGALGLWIQSQAAREVPSPAVGTAVEVAAPTATEAPLELAAATTPRAEIEVRTEPTPDEPVAATPQKLTLSGRVIDTSQRPVAGLEVGFRLQDATRPEVSTTTDAGGRFSMERVAPELEPWSAMNALFAKISGGELVVTDPLFTALVLGILGEDELVLVVAPRLAFAGRVVDETGAAIENALVSVRVRQGLYREIGLTQFASLAEAHDWETRTEADGTFRLAEACGGERIYLEATHQGYAPAELELPEHARHDLEVALTPIDGILVTGHVLDDGGAPVAEAQVSMGHTIERTAVDGSFSIHWNAKETEGITRNVQRADGVWVSQQDPLHIAALKAGHAPAWLDLEEADLSEPLELRLGPAPLSIAGRVVDEDGAPLAGVVVWATDLTTFGRRHLQQGEQSAWMGTTVEEENRGGGAGSRGTTSASDGTFELTGLMPREYTLQVYDPRTAVQGPGWSLAAGTDDAELVLPRDASLARVAGRVVSLAGRPIPGVLIQIERSSPVYGASAQLNPPENLQQAVATDAEGRFEFPELATEGTELLLFGERIFFRHAALADFEDLGRIEIVEPLLCELQVELGDSPELADRVQVLDDEGENLEILEFFGITATMSPRARIQEGRSGVLRVSETARTLVLSLGETEVARRRLDLDPFERTVVRP